MGGVSPDEDQLRVLGALGHTLPKDFYLAGGVGVAAHLRHRASHDLDIFALTSDPCLFETDLTIAQYRIVSRAPGTVHLEASSVPVSLLLYRYPLIAPLTVIPDVAIQVASLEDLAAMKLSAIAGRGTRRDFWDLHEMMHARAWPLQSTLQLFERKYAGVDIGHVIRSLVYFGDADQEPLPRGLTPSRWAAIRSDFESSVKQL